MAEKTKEVPLEPTPAMIKAGWDLINSDRFSASVRHKLTRAGLGVVELWKAMHEAAE